MFMYCVWVIMVKCMVMCVFGGGVLTERNNKNQVRNKKILEISYKIAARVRK